MPDDSAGNYTRPPSPIPTTGQGADAPQVNVPIDDMASALNRRHFSDGRKPFLGDQNFNGYKAIGAAEATDPQDYVTLAQVQAMLDGIVSIPTGAIIHWPSNAVPAGWLRLNGQSVSRSTFASLYAFAVASGAMASSEGAKTAGQFGPGNGSATFTLPNLEADGGYFLRPVSSGRGVGTVQADTVGPHPHPASFLGDPVPPHNHSYGTWELIAGNALGGAQQGGRSSQTTGAGGGHTPSGTVTVSNNTGTTETRPRNIAFPVLIKT